MITVSTIVLTLTIGASPTRPANRHAAPPRADTIDVPVGSPLVDGRHMTAFTTHLQVFRIVEGASTLMQEARNTISFGDSAGRAVTYVVSNGEASGPAGKRTIAAHFTFDRRTLELLATSLPSPNGPIDVAVDGATLRVHMPGASSSAEIPLSQRAFYGQWSDYIVEELPMREGVAYRVPLWQPTLGPNGPGATVTQHLYVVRGREDVEVFGKTHRKAWVVDDRSADGSKLLGTMWIVDGPPKLVRWTINADDGSTVRIDQELVARP
jgi:hypothetical protein